LLFLVGDVAFQQVDADLDLVQTALARGFDVLDGAVAREQHVVVAGLALLLLAP
jgi:hypothetical protein